MIGFIARERQAGYWALHFGLLDEKESYAAAARIYFDCRKKGITVNSTVDCLIAQTAIENDLTLLHNDADFDRMRKVALLKIYGS